MSHNICFLLVGIQSYREQLCNEWLINTCYRSTTVKIFVRDRPFVWSKVYLVVPDAIAFLAQMMLPYNRFTNLRFGSWKQSYFILMGSR